MKAGQGRGRTAPPGAIQQHYEDPPDPAPVSSPDPDDDYLLALAISQRAFLVTADQHLLGLREDLPILTPTEFVSKLRENG